jgi:PKD repeat protein
MKMTFMARGLALLAVLWLGCEGAEGEAPPEVATQQKKLGGKKFESMAGPCESALQPLLLVVPAEDAAESMLKFKGKELLCGETYELVVSEPDGESLSESLVADMKGTVQSAHSFDGESGERQATLYDSNGEQVAQVLSHNTIFRYGHLTWRPVGPRTAEFSAINGFRRIYSGSGPDGLVVTGDTFQESTGFTNLCFGDGACTGTLTYQVTSYDAQQGWVIAKAVGTSQPQKMPGTGVLVVETEPNNTIASANSMQLGDDYFSHISSSGETDFVRFTLSQRTRVELRTSLLTLGDSYLYLYNSAGTLLASDDDGGGGLTSLITITLDAGTYYIGARGFGSSTGQQYVQLRELRIPAPGPITRTYTSDGPFTAYLSGCCRISLANPNTNYLVRSVVRFSPANSSPVSTLPPVIDAPVNNASFSFQVPATDAEGDQLTFRIATPTESNLYTAPPGLTVSSTGLVTWNTVGTTVGQLWGVQVVIEERRSGVLIGSSAVDFLLRVTGASGTAPSCLPPSQTSYTVNVGQPVQFTVGTRDTDINDSLRLSASGVPTGALMQPALPLQGPSGISSTFSWTPPSTAGGFTYQMIFTVTDTSGQSGQCTVRVTVQTPPANRPPVANAGPDQSVSPGTTVTLNGTGSSDPDGQPITYLWSQMVSSGPAVTLSSTTSATPSFTTSGDGTYTFMLTVTDSQGATASDTVVVRVVNQPPVANAGSDQVVNEGATVRLNGSGSDPEGGTVTYRWSIVSSDGPEVTLSSTTSLTPSFPTTDNGTYTLMLTATDSQGATGTDTVIVRVNNVFPTVSTTGGEINEGEVFTSTGVFSDPGADTWAATVDYGDGTGVQPLELGDGSFTLSHHYTDSTPGPFFTVEIAITDDDGGRSTLQVPVVVNNISPVIISAPSNIVTTEGQLASASFTFTDPGEETWEVIVSYGDGTSESMQLAGREFTLQHMYLAGSYVMEVQLQDGDGGYATVQIPVEVQNVAPVVSFSMFNANEGDWTWGSGSFDDPSWMRDSFTLTVDYGDGSGVQELYAWGNEFGLDHFYADSGTYQVTVTVTDSFGAVGTATMPVVIENVAPWMEVYGMWGEEGGSTAGIWGQLYDPGYQDTFTITVDYGDGTPVETQELTSNPFELHHTYTNNGEYMVTVTVTDDEGGSTTLPVWLYVFNVEPQLQGLPEDAELTEGSMFRASGSFTDPGADTWQAWVDYGDGAGFEPLPLNGKTFELEHFYADNNWGSYVTVMIQDSDGSLDSEQFPIYVASVAPELSIPTDGELLESSTFRASGSFTDPGADTWQAWVHWGEPNTDGEPLTLNGKSFELEHFYADSGTYYVTVGIQDDDGEWTSTWMTVTVHNVAPEVTSITGGELNEGSLLDTSISFTDPGDEDEEWLEHGYGRWSVQVDYGDGTVNSFVLENKEDFTLSHWYMDNGVYTLTVRIFDGEDVGTATSQVIVHNVDPQVWLQEGSVADEGYYFRLFGQVLDPGWDTWTVNVDFGDGSPAETFYVYWWNWDHIFDVDHIYADNGTFPMTLTVTDDDGGVAVITRPIEVRNVAPYLGLESYFVTAAEGSVATATAWFFDTGADTWTLTVDYGDGSPSEQILPAPRPNSRFRVPHVYKDNGFYWMTLTITDEDGGVGTIKAWMSVSNVAPTATALNDSPGYWGLPINLVGLAMDPSQTDTEAGFTALWSLGDGTTASSLNAAHAYAAPGSYWALLTVTDKDGGFNRVPAATAVTIEKRPGAVTCQDTTAAFGFPAVLNAQFVDGLAGGLPGGRSLSFHLGGSTNLGSATTDATGLGSVQSPGELAPGSYAVTVSFAGDSLYTAAEASCTLTVTQSSGKITGGGLRLANNSRGGFNVMLAAGGSVEGELQFQNDTTSFHAHVMSALGLSANKRTGWFAGVGRDGRAFTAYLEDNGEPGSGDVFKLWIDGTLQTGDGTLSGGNIQIH